MRQNTIKTIKNRLFFSYFTLSQSENILKKRNTSIIMDNKKKKWPRNRKLEKIMQNWLKATKMVKS